MHDPSLEHDEQEVPVPSRQAVASAVEAVLVRTLGVDAARIRPDAALEDLGIDSLKTIEMNVALEEELGFASPEVARPDELGIVTVDDLVSHVARMLAGGGR
jgi:acyl carrier protein